jgi:hypothetical protein
VFQLLQRKHKQPAIERQASQLQGAHVLPRRKRTRRQRPLIAFQREKGLAAALSARYVAYLRDQPKAAGTGQHQHLLRIAGHWATGHQLLGRGGPVGLGGNVVGHSSAFNVAYGS